MSLRALIPAVLLVAAPALAEPYASQVGALSIEVGAREIVVSAAEGPNPCGFPAGTELFRGVRAGALARGAMTLCQVGPRCAQIERADAVLAVARRGDLVVVAVAPPRDASCPRALSGPVVATRTRGALETVVPKPPVEVVPPPEDACGRAAQLRLDALRALRAKETGQAAGLIATAVELCPTSRAARLTAGEIAIARGRLSEAEAVGALLVDDNPLDFDAHALIARSLAGRAAQRAEAREKLAAYLRPFPPEAEPSAAAER